MNIHNFSRRLSPFLTVYLLLVSLGLPLHKVYCACKGESDFSLISSAQTCGRTDEGVCTVDLTSEVAKDSHCSKGTTHCTMAETDAHDCGSNETIFTKLTGDYLFQQARLFTALNPVTLPRVVPSATPLATAYSARTNPIRGPDPPPPPYGRDLLLRCQLFLC